LKIASKFNHSDILELLLDYGADINSTDDYGETELIKAVRDSFGVISTVKLLLDTGKVDIDKSNNYGETALSLATNIGHYEMVLLLIEYGANINGIRHNEKPLINAILGLVKSDNNDVSVAHNLVGYINHTNVVNLLLSNNTDIDQTDEEGCTALMYAAQYDELDLVNTLLEKDPNIDLFNQKGKTALSIAIEKGYEHIAEAIRNYLNGQSS